MLLKLKGLTVDCVIGERPDERTRLQTLQLEIVLSIPDRAGETDELADTVDYAVLADRIRARLVAAKCRMIERAAVLAVETCLKDSRVLSAKVTVRKTGAVEGLESAEVEYECGR